jgi:rhodanese-related sulfurtransferase
MQALINQPHEATTPMKTPTSLPRGLRLFTTAAALAAALVSLPMAARADSDKATTEALESYFEFIDYNSGTLMSEQIPAEDWKKLYVLDVRDAGQFGKEHIPGAVNIEWRKVFAERAKLPKDQTILAYCNTGSFSAQAAMALRMAGYENVRILHGGFNEWKARGGLDANARAAK